MDFTLPRRAVRSTRNSNPFSPSPVPRDVLCTQGVFGYEPLRKGRRERLEDLWTGDGRTPTGTSEGAGIGLGKAYLPLPLQHPASTALTSSTVATF